MAQLQVRGPGLEVRGTIDVEKFKAAKTLGGGDTKFELRAMKPVGPGQLSTSCIVCIVCIVCVVCSAEKAKQFGISQLPSISA